MNFILTMLIYPNYTSKLSLDIRELINKPKTTQNRVQIRTPTFRQGFLKCP